MLILNLKSKYEIARSRRDILLSDIKEYNNSYNDIRYLILNLRRVSIVRTFRDQQNLNNIPLKANNK